MRVYSIHSETCALKILEVNNKNISKAWICLTLYTALFMVKFSMVKSTLPIVGDMSSFLMVGCGVLIDSALSLFVPLLYL